MTNTSVEAATGDLLVDGKRMFPLGLSDPPPVAGRTPDGDSAWAEIARAGVTFARNYSVWSESAVAEQLLAVRSELDAAVTHGLQLWVGLAGIDDSLAQQALLESVVDGLKDHPGLGVWKGVDEPAHGRVPVAGCVAVYRRLRSLDPNHPVAIIEAPRSPAPTAHAADRRLTATAVRPYAAACDIHGVDIYPISRPPGLHAGGPPVNTDISVVGDVTRIVASATGRRAIWTTLQIAWSGVLPPHPTVFPTLPQARFMAYDAIIAGARGLFFFGGQLPAAMAARDRHLGWNWTYWDDVQRSLLEELSEPSHQQALLAPPATHAVTADASDIVLSARQTASSFYLIAACSGTGRHGPVRFSGLPASATNGIVLAHPGGNPARPVQAHEGSFTDPSAFVAHNARVYHFPLPG